MPVTGPLQSRCIPQNQMCSAPAWLPWGLFLFSSIMGSEPAACGRRGVASGGECQRQGNGAALGGVCPRGLNKATSNVEKGTAMWGTQSPEEIHCVSAESREKGELPFTGHQGTSCVLGILGGLINGTLQLPFSRRENSASGRLSHLLEVRLSLRSHCLSAGGRILGSSRDQDFGESALHPLCLNQALSLARWYFFPLSLPSSPSAFKRQKEGGGPEAGKLSVSQCSLPSKCSNMPPIVCAGAQASLP